MIPKGLVKLKKVDVGLGLIKKIKEDLSITPMSTSSFNKNPEMIRCYSEDEEHLAVPRFYFLDKLWKKYRFIDKSMYDFTPTSGKGFLPDIRPIAMRDGQEEVVSGCIEKMRSHDFGGAIAEVVTAGGKTVCSIEIARRLGMKTLVIVHSTALFPQWADEIKKFAPAWSIGQIQSDTIDIKGRDICLGMLHSLAFKDDYPEWIYEEFGFVITDEIHLSGAAEFSKALPRFPSKYLLGLTGTLKHKDRCEKIFINNVGPVVSGMSTVKAMIPHVYLVDTKFAWRPKYEAPPDILKNFFLNGLILSEQRNTIIIDQAVKAAMAGRNPLVLTERVEHAKHLFIEIQKRIQGTDLSVGILIGEIKKESERERSKQARIIVATVQLIGVGFNVPRLDTLIFASPIQEVIQSTGRIRRIVEGKKDPFVLDLVDSNAKHSVMMAKARLKRYKEQKWIVHGEKIFEDIKRRNLMFNELLNNKEV